MADPAPVAAPVEAPTPAPAVAPAVAPAADPPAGAGDPPPAPSVLNQVDEPELPLFDSAAFVKELKLPDGLKADDPNVSKFADLIGNPKLSAKDRAESLLTLQAEIAKASSETLTKQWNDAQLEWQGKVKADPEIGGDKLQPTLQSISRALDGTLGQELATSFRQVMDFTGAGNHPAVVKALAKFATHMAEGGHIPGDPSKGKMSTAQVFFPNSPEFESQKGNG